MEHFAGDSNLGAIALLALRRVCLTASPQCGPPATFLRGGTPLPLPVRATRTTLVACRSSHTPQEKKKRRRRKKVLYSSSIKDELPAFPDL
jgi:hypothetical protein